MVEFSDLFDNEDECFQKKAKVCITHTPTTLQSMHLTYTLCLNALSISHSPIQSVPAFAEPAWWIGEQMCSLKCNQLHWEQIVWSRDSDLAAATNTLFKQLTCKSLSERQAEQVDIHCGCMLVNCVFLCLVRRRDSKDVHERGSLWTPVIHHAPPQGLRNSKTISESQATYNRASWQDALTQSGLC